MEYSLHVLHGSPGMSESMTHSLKDTAELFITLCFLSVYLCSFVSICQTKDWFTSWYQRKLTTWAPRLKFSQLANQERKTTYLFLRLLIYKFKSRFSFFKGVGIVLGKCSILNQWRNDLSAGQLWRKNGSAKFPCLHLINKTSFCFQFIFFWYSNSNNISRIIIANIYWVLGSLQRMLMIFYVLFCVILAIILWGSIIRFLLELNNTRFSKLK